MGNSPKCLSNRFRELEIFSLCPKSGSNAISNLVSVYLKEELIGRLSARAMNERDGERAQLYNAIKWKKDLKSQRKKRTRAHYQPCIIIPLMWISLCCARFHPYTGPELRRKPIIHFIFPRFSSKNPGPHSQETRTHTRPLLFSILLVIFHYLLNTRRIEKEENNFIQAFDATYYERFFSSVTSWRTMRFILDTERLVTACLRANSATWIKCT